jgi:NAD(P)-dependent dehydrogenase (short-subunit alcohol dehydrogenase family)
MANKKTVIVTGASQGIGAAVVHAFLNRGYNVVATSRSVSKAGLAPSPNLALVDGDIGQAATAENVARTAIDKFVLAAAKNHLGSLDRVTRVIRLGVFIVTSGDFFDQPKVADAASDLFRDVFGEDKMAVRLVIGVASLPLGVPIELDVIFEVSE